MTHHWEFDDLVEHVTILPPEQEWIATIHAPHNRLGFAVLLKFFCYAGRFPDHRHDVPLVIVEHLARQLHLPVSAYLRYDWHGRTIKTHRADIRHALGFREATVQDTHALTTWLCDYLRTTHERQVSHVRDRAYAYGREQKIEPPTPDRLERMVRSALATYQEQLHTRMLERLAPDLRSGLDALLTTDLAADPNADDPTDPAASQRTTLQMLKADAGPVRVATATAEVAKLSVLRAIPLPVDLFRDLPVPVLRTYAQQVQGEEPPWRSGNEPRYTCVVPMGNTIGVWCPPSCGY